MDDVKKGKEKPNSPHPLHPPHPFDPIATDSTETNYIESLMHLFKGNIGVGLFAMGDAFKNGGIYASIPLSVFLGLVCTHCQHILLSCTEVVSSEHYDDDDERIEYPEAVELCFAYGHPGLVPLSKVMRKLCNILIFITQIGFCCIYLTVIATNVQQILISYNIYIEIYYMVLIIWVPIWWTSLITNLKALVPVSCVANLCLVFCFVLTLYFSLKDKLPSVEERRPYTNAYQLALFFGTAIFAFEGIAAALPIKNSMKKPNDFNKPLGVLNVGMIFVVTMYMLSGFCGYLKWGEDVAATTTLNIGDSILAQSTKGILSLGIMFSYPLQFFIPIITILPSVLEKCNFGKRPLLCELLLRTGLSVLTVLIAMAFPNVGIFISLLGGVCSTILALIFPPLMECLLLHNTIQNSKFVKCLKIFKNCIILMIAILSFTVGTYVNVTEVVKYFKGETSLHDDLSANTINFTNF